MYIFMTALAMVFKWSCGLECPYLVPPANTNRSSNATTPGTTITYNCTTSDKTFSNDQRSMETECLSSGSWSTLPEPCKTRRCPALDVIPNSRLIYSTMAGATVGITCMPGFAFSDRFITKNLKCNPVSLTWETEGFSRETLICDQQFCPSLPSSYETMIYEGENGFVPSKGVPVAHVINGYCKEGYHRPPDSKVMVSGTCSPSKAYDPNNFGECIKKTCRIPVVDNTMIVTHNTEYQKRYKLQCSNGGKFPNGSDTWVMECDNNGQWKSEPPKGGCQVRGCEPGWIEYNSSCYYFSDPKSFGLRYNSAEQSCLDRSAHLVTISSKIQNTFLTSNSFEKTGKDYWIGYHYDGSKWTWKGESSTYKGWLRGYPEEHNCTRLTVSGFWKDRRCDDLNAYICSKPAMCGIPPAIENGGPTVINVPNSINVGDKLMYKCRPGFSFRSDGTTEKEIKCLPGSFYSYIENCIATMCPPINRIGYKVNNASPDKLTNSYLSTIAWTCKTGFIFPDGKFTKNMTCLANRTWSEIPPSCIRVHCPSTPVSTYNALAKYDRVDVGDVDWFTCVRGFEFDTGEREMAKICRPTGHWYPESHCWRKKCKDYVQINGTVKSSKLTDFKFEDEITVTCNDGYEFPDGTKSKKTWCGDNYHWDPYLPPCQIMKCPGNKPPTVTNAFTNTTDTAIGTLVKYTCISGHKFIDGDSERTSYCDPEKVAWVNVPLECKDKWPEIESNIVMAGTVASTAFAAVCLLAFSVILMVVLCIHCSEDRKHVKVCSKWNEKEDTEEEEDDEEEAGKVEVEAQPSKLTFHSKN